MKPTLFAFSILVAVTVAGCASQPAPSQSAPGFLMGLVHGLIVPITFAGSLFASEVRMYAFPNAGVAYDFGFLLGLACWGAGGAASVQDGSDEEGEEINRLRRKVRRLRRRLRGE